MTALPPVPGVLKVALRGVIGSHNWAVIMHQQWTGTGPNTGDLDTFATDIGTFWGAVMKGLFPSSVILETTQVTDLTSALGAQGNAAPAIAGTNAAAEISGNAAILVNYPSSFRYRGGHPRSYLPPGGQADLQTPSTWTSAFITSTTTAFGTFLNDLATYSSASFDCAGQCAVSYIWSDPPGTPGQRRTIPLVMPIATGAFTVEAEVASQRRRIGRK